MIGVDVLLAGIVVYAVCWTGAYLLDEGVHRNS